MNRVRMTSNLALLAVASFCLAALTGRADIHYVDIANASPAHPFTNGWSSAANDIQSAIGAAVDGDTVLVTNGLYDTGGVAGWPAGTFLTNRVAVTNAITLRAASTNRADTTIAGAPDPVSGVHGDAAVRGVYLGAGAKLIGFTVTNGHSRLWTYTSSDGWAGGIYADASSTISNCDVSYNHAFYGAGGYEGTYVDCRIAHNNGWYGAGLMYGSASCCLIANNTGQYGGGARVRPTGTLYGCTIVSNYAGSHGGGVVAGNVVNCRILSNTAASHSGGLSGVKAYQCDVIDNKGGGVGGGGGPSTVERCVIRGTTAGYAINGGIAINCLVTGNTSFTWGRGVVYPAVGALATPVLINCTVVSNTAPSGEGVIKGATLTNCIVYYNTPKPFEYSTMSVDYCCVSSTNGISNLVSGAHINTDTPLFADGDYRLAKGSGGLDVGIDLSSSFTNDLDGTTRPLDGGTGLGFQWDMGCYEVDYFVPPGTMFHIR